MLNKNVFTLFLKQFFVVQKDFQCFLRLVFYAKFRPKLSLHSIPGDQDFNKSKSTLPKDATTQVTAFMGFKKIYKDFFLKRENSTPQYGPTLSPGIMI